MMSTPQHNTSLATGTAVPAPVDNSRRVSTATHSVLVNGKLLSGAALLEHAKQKGLCTRCVNTQTHQRVRKKVNMFRFVPEYQPLTKMENGNYVIYKGYCLQPTCWTLEEVQQRLGERIVMKRQNSSSRVQPQPRRRSKSRHNIKNGNNSDHNRGLDEPSSNHSNRSANNNNKDIGAKFAVMDTASSDFNFDLEDTNNDTTNNGDDGDDDDDAALLEFAAKAYADVAAAEGERERQKRGRRRMSSVVPTSRAPSTRQLLDTVNGRPNGLRRASSTRIIISATTNNNTEQEGRPNSNGRSGGGGGGGGRRNVVRRHTSDPFGSDLMQPPNNNTTAAPRTRQRATRVPDVDILTQLCPALKKTSGTLSDASDDNLWSILQKRYGGNTNGSAKLSQVQILLQILHGNGTDLICIERAWILFSTIVQTNNNDMEHRIVEDILEAITSELDQADIVRRNIKKHVIQTLFVLLKNAEYSFDGPVLAFLQGMASQRRQHWMSSLSDLLDEREVRVQEGTTETLFVIWNLLLSQPRQHHHQNQEPMPAEEVVLMRTIVGMAVSVLSSEGPVHDKLLPETALGLLSTVASRGGVYVLTERRMECLQVICRTMLRPPSQETVLLQGAHSMCHILASSPWFEYTSAMATVDGKELPQNLSTAKLVAQVAIAIFKYQEEVPQEDLRRQEDLSSAACQLLTMLIESNREIRRFAMELPEITVNGPLIIKALVEMLARTSSDIPLEESTAETLLFLLKRDYSMCGHLRQLPDAATTLMELIQRYHKKSPFVQECICMIAAHLVSLEDHHFGQELGQCGGLKTISDMLLSSSPNEFSFIEAATRALMGVLTSVDRGLYRVHLADICKAIVFIMQENTMNADIQLAALDVLHCMSVRLDDVRNGLTDAIGAVVSSMENHLGSVNILTQSCVVIRLVARNSDDTTIFVSSINMVVNAMLIHPASTEFIMEGMATIKDLAAEPTLRQYFDQSDAERVVTALLGGNAYNPDVLALAFATLNNIVVDSSRGAVALMQRSVLNSIITALDHYPTDQWVTKNACLLLKSYTYDEENLAVMREESETIIALLVGSSESQTNDTRERAQYIMRKLYGQHNNNYVGTAERIPRGL